MILESDVRERLAAVANHALSLEDFAEWIGDESWDMDRDSSPEAVDLVSSIHVLLGERDDRVLDDDALRQKIIGLLNNVRASLVLGNPGDAAMIPRPSASKAYRVRPAQPWELPTSA